MLLPWLADRLVLSPTRHAIFPYGKARRLVPWRGGQIEVWCERTGPAEASRDSIEPECFVLKLLGKAARAERATLDPLDHWSDLAGEIWSVNPPGYGGSSGRASLQTVALAAESVFEQLVRVADGRPIFIAGDSLGTMSALYIAARHSHRGTLAGLILRNAGSLNRLIARRYARRSLGLSRLLAGAVPASLDSVANAAEATVPAVMLTSGRDEVMPPQYQQLVANAYAGPLERLVLPKALHEMRLSKRDREAYGRALDWLREETLPERAATRCEELATAGR